MFDVGLQELIIIFIVALLVFGPEKLPEVGRTLGKWMIELKRGVYSAKTQLETELEEPYKKPEEEFVNTLPKDAGPEGAGNENELEKDKA